MRAPLVQAPAGTLLLTQSEVAAELRCSARMVHDLIDRGQLPAVRIGRRLKVKRADLERWVDDPDKSTIRRSWPFQKRA